MTDQRRGTRASSGTTAARGAFVRLRHDLRTKIDQILGYSELLREEAEEGRLNALVADVGRIQEAARSVLEMIDGLLEVRGPAAWGEAATSVHGRTRDGPERSDTLLDEGPAGRILVVDDDPSGRDLMTRRLGELGHRVEGAEDGRAALHRLESGDLDVVLLDVVLPGMGGLEVLAKIRERWSPTELPVVMVTGEGDSDTVVKAYSAGANDFVTKPVDFAVMTARVRTLIELRHASASILELVALVELRNHVIRQIFGRYLTDEVVESLLEQPEGLTLGGEKRRITVMMADLRGFTPMAEGMPPEEVLKLINIFLGEMSEVIISFGGTIDEFLGDAILVLFGAPVPRDDHAAAAVACALKMREAMTEVNRRSRNEGLPEVAMGVGIHTGEVVVGNIGSEKRAKYGVVGHAVNLAARIQSYCRGGQILISESTFDECGGSLRVNGELVVTPKGVPGPVRLIDVG